MADDLLIDGPGVYKIFSGSQEITLNIRGRTFSHRSSPFWDAVKAVQSETGFEVLLEGKEERAGQFQVWTVSNHGAITDRSRWMKVDQMVELGYEEIFGRDFNVDSITGIPPINDINENGLIYGVDEGSSHYKLKGEDGQAISLTHRGRTFSHLSSPSWDAVKAVQAETGFEVLLEGEGKRAGEFSVWSADGGGVIADRSRWLTADQMLTFGYEEIFDRDFNADTITGQPPVEDRNDDGLIYGSVEGSSIYKLLKDGDQALNMINAGRTLSDETSSLWKAVKAVETEMGFEVLLEGEGKRADQFRVWSAHGGGVITDRSRWLTVDQMLELGYEKIFERDFNGDGLVDGSSTYKLLRDGQDIALIKSDPPVDGQAITLSHWGRTLSDRSSSHWDAVEAVEADTGFYVLLKGADKREGRFLVWRVNTFGLIDGHSGWATGEQMQALGYEAIFARDFNDDGVIQQPANGFGSVGLLPGAGQFLPLPLAMG